jgi:SAM-dependent methyltransferase
MNALAPILTESDALTARERFVRFVRWTLDRELPRCTEFMSEPDRDLFVRDGLLVPPATGADRDRHIRALWRGPEGWMSRWVAERAEQLALRGMSPQLLDAGAGFGTHAMLFSAMGAEVVGTECGADHLDTAMRRLEFYGDDTGVALDLRYERSDLMRPWSRRYDAIWVDDVLWHLHPMQAFIDEVRRRLTPGGVIVASVVNGSHHANCRTLGSFTPWTIRKIFEERGFRIVHHELLWDRTSGLPDAVYQGVVVPLQGHLMLGRYVGRRQLFVAAVR